MISAATPSTLWFATRGAGVITMVLLTLVIVLGSITAAGTRARWWPRFLSSGLHRNLSLLAVLFLAVHVATSLLDPFAHLGWRDAAIPFASAYRPFWLGLGVISAELVVALILTSLVRPLLGHAAWRGIHWLGFAAWPVAIIHGLGTGTDARARWMLATTVACVALVVVAIGLRMGSSRPRLTIVRPALAAVIATLVAASTAWAVTGPIQPGWSRRAGTPVALILKGGGAAQNGRSKPAPTAAAAAPPQAPLVLPSPVIGGPDLLSATSVPDPAGGIRLILTDLRDPALQFVVRPARPGEGGPVLARLRGGNVDCVAAATVSNTIEAVCGHQHISLLLQTVGDIMTGRLVVTPG